MTHLIADEIRKKFAEEQRTLIVKRSNNDWDYNATPDIYCPHCHGIQGYDVRKYLPEEDGLASVISCQHCERDFAVRGVQTIVWDVATDLRSLCDDELGPKE